MTTPAPPDELTLLRKMEQAVKDGDRDAALRYAREAEGVRESTPAVTATCKASHRFPKAPGSRAANVVCEKPSGHPGAHEAIQGSTAYCWSCKHEERCCPEHDVHLTPHRGCILR